MSNLQQLENGAVVMCCGGKGCPTLRIDDDVVLITDDHGNEVKITSDEAELLDQALQQAKRDK